MKIVIEPADEAIVAYHQRLQEARRSSDTQHEGNIRHAFANLLEATARKRKWTLVQEHSVRTNTAGGRLIDTDSQSYFIVYNNPHDMVYFFSNEHYQTYLLKKKNLPDD